MEKYQIEFFNMAENKVEFLEMPEAITGFDIWFNALLYIEKYMEDKNLNLINVSRISICLAKED